MAELAQSSSLDQPRFHCDLQVAELNSTSREGLKDVWAGHKQFWLLKEMSYRGKNGCSVWYFEVSGRKKRHQKRRNSEEI